MKTTFSFPKLRLLVLKYSKGRSWRLQGAVSPSKNKRHIKFAFECSNEQGHIA